MHLFSDTKQFRDLLFIQFRSDHTDPSGIFCRSAAYLMLFRHHIKVDPLSVFSLDHSFCTEDRSVRCVALQCLQNFRNAFFCVRLCRLAAPACKHFICMMMMSMLMMVMPVIMSAAAAAFFPVFVVMVGVVVMIVMMLMIVMVLMVVMVLVVVMMLMVMAACTLLVMIVMMLMVMTACALLIMIVMMLK